MIADTPFRRVSEAFGDRSFSFINVETVPAKSESCLKRLLAGRAVRDGIHHLSTIRTALSEDLKMEKK